MPKDRPVAKRVMSEDYLSPLLAAYDARLSQRDAELKECSEGLSKLQDMVSKRLLVQVFIILTRVAVTKKKTFRLLIHFTIRVSCCLKTDETSRR